MDSEIFIPVAAAFWIVNWAAALLVTGFVWPWRVVTSRWPVVAYPADFPDKTQRQSVNGTAEADALARHWAVHLKEHGQLSEQVASTRR